MSLWFRRKDKQGRVHLYQVDVPWPFALMAIGALAVAILLLLCEWLRGLLF